MRYGQKQDQANFTEWRLLLFIEMRKSGKAVRKIVRIIRQNFVIDFLSLESIVQLIYVYKIGEIL